MPGGIWPQIGESLLLNMFVCVCNSAFCRNAEEGTPSGVFFFWGGAGRKLAGTKRPDGLS